MKSFKNHKNIKMTTIIKWLFLGVLLLTLSVMLISDIACLIFMIIKNTTGYCTPFMANTIEKIYDINITALKMWDEDC